MGKPPHMVVKRGHHFTRFPGDRNFPQDTGTRPVYGIYLPAPLHAQTRTQVQTGLYTAECYVE